MKVQPLYSYPPPCYPDRGQALRQPQLLLTLPQRWRRNRSVCAALVSLAAILLSSCANDDHLAGPTQGGQTDRVQSATPTPTSPGVVAPLFQHGEGRGGFGCVSVAPPAFLSEAEAYDVIAQAAKEAGIEMSRPGPTITHVQTPLVRFYAEQRNEAIQGTAEQAVQLDGQDICGKVAFEFVSTDDLESWHKDEGGVRSSVTSYAFELAAGSLRDGLAQVNPPMAVGVFYDPGYAYNDAVKKIITETGYEKEAEMVRQLKELVKADLRAQVLDFLAWLKAQGIV